jgi:hypothetical protein
LRNEILRQPIPAEFRDDIDIHLSGLYTLILHSRSDVGRATSPEIDRDMAHGNLLVFPRYCQRVYQLLEWFTPSGSRLDESQVPTEVSVDPSDKTAIG